MILNFMDLLSLIMFGVVMNRIYKTFVIFLVLSIILLVGILASGATFGQRCEKMGHEWYSASHDSCVKKLSKGK